MQGDVNRYVRSCDLCQRTIPKGRVWHVPLGNMPTIETLFKCVAIDIIGSLSPASRERHRYVLTMVDIATRYPDAVTLRSCCAPEIAEGLV